MQALAEYRLKRKGVADFLNWAFIVAQEPDGLTVMLNKDGSLTTAFYFRGDDFGSATNEEMNALAFHANAALAKFGTGWLINIDSPRVHAMSYPPESGSHFPDPVTALIDAERRVQHETEGAHFDNVYAMAFTYRLPSEVESRVASFFVDDDQQLNVAAKERRAEMEMGELLQRFCSHVRDAVASFSTSLQMRPMSPDDLCTYLHSCLTGEEHRVIAPPPFCALDAVLSSKDFRTGLAPRIGQKHIRIVTVMRFPAETMPAVLDQLARLPFVYRWSTRWIPMDPPDAEKVLGTYRRNWWQKRHGLMGLVKSAAGGAQTWSNGDAVSMAGDADQAINEARSGAIRFGYYTTVLVIMSDTAQQADAQAEQACKFLGNIGFPSQIEDINAVEAFIGSLPAHGYQNVRRPLIHTLNLAHLLPLTAVWTGNPTNPCPFLPKNSPPLLHAATSGATPFRLSLHVGDVGHFAVLGPTGAGKSTALNLLIAQHFRYPNAQVFAFDFGYSMAALCEAAGGVHYDLGGDGGDHLGFCPLGEIDTPADRAWAAQFVELMVTMRLQEGKTLSISQVNEIARAINAMAAETTSPDQRTITHFRGTVQDEEIQAALSLYTVGSSAIGDLLDASEDAFNANANARFFVFEMANLGAMGERAIVPVMLYIFRQIKRKIRRSIPTLIPIDEAFRSFSHPKAIAELDEWLETMRKDGAAVGFATQNVDKVLKSMIGSTLIQATPTKILLPNKEATSQSVSPLYRTIGLNDRQIQNLANATPKRDYYVMSPEGRRMFDLGLGRVALAFLGAAGKDALKEVRQMKAQYGQEWVAAWLASRAVPAHWITYFRKLKEKMQ